MFFDPRIEFSPKGLVVENLERHPAHKLTDHSMHKHYYGLFRETQCREMVYVLAFQQAAEFLKLRGHDHERYCS